MEPSSASSSWWWWGFRCVGAQGLESGVSALPGSLLFGLGVAGNVLALALLWRHRRAARLRRPCLGGALPSCPHRPPRASAFYLLASALVATDLLGKCLLSPMVLAAYAKNRTLSALWPAHADGEGGGREEEPGRLCQLFAFLMSFFGLAPTALLLGMALECYLSLAQPYFYERHTSRRGGALVGGLAAALCALLCALPALGFGAWAQYCPGTWCFMRLRGTGRHFALLYASLLAALGLALAAANLGTMRCLYAMALRQPPRHPWDPTGTRRKARKRKRKAFPGAGATEELAQLALLALMTALFAVCSLPVIIRAYVGAFAPDHDEKADLTALRFFSVNSIVDPWVFIIFRTSLFRSWLRRLSWRLSSKKAPCAQQQESWQQQGSGPLQ